jgi:uncharacterized protein YktA (UPF0223 family)
MRVKYQNKIDKLHILKNGHKYNVYVSHKQSEKQILRRMSRGRKKVQWHEPMSIARDLKKIERSETRRMHLIQSVKHFLRGNESVLRRKEKIDFDIGDLEKRKWLNQGQCT